MWNVNNDGVVKRWITVTLDLSANESIPIMQNLFLQIENHNYF